MARFTLCLLNILCVQSQRPAGGFYQGETCGWASQASYAGSEGMGEVRERGGMLDQPSAQFLYCLLLLIFGAEQGIVKTPLCGWSVQTTPCFSVVFASFCLFKAGGCAGFSDSSLLLALGSLLRFVSVWEPFGWSQLNRWKGSLA